MNWSTTYIIKNSFIHLYTCVYKIFFIYIHTHLYIKNKRASKIVYVSELIRRQLFP